MKKILVLFYCIAISYCFANDVVWVIEHQTADLIVMRKIIVIKPINPPLPTQMPAPWTKVMTTNYPVLPITSIVVSNLPVITTWTNYVKTNVVIEFGVIEGTNYSKPVAIPPN